MTFAPLSFGPSWFSRRLAGLMWRFEHAFERARAAGRAEDDTRIRIFVVLILFSMGFIVLGMGATHAALFSKAGEGDAFAPPQGAARADLVDRNGQMLAADLLHYGLYIDPREIWDTDETRHALTSALPELTPERLEKALKAGRRTFVTGGLTPEVRADHASYIESWLKVLKDDKRAIFTAAAHAQRAADYLNGLQPGLQQEAAE